MFPRPILKRSARCATSPSSSTLAVHFPPATSLTTHTYAVYSAAVYDRSPIQVSPNACKLPERGCPGRTYTLDDTPAPSEAKRGHPYGGRDLHPRAIAFNAARQQQDAACSSDSVPPPLIPDLSSESDESDGFYSPPMKSYSPTNHTHGLAIPKDRYLSYSSFDVDPYVARPMSPNALSFLPHPPSPPSSRSPYSSYDNSTSDEPQTPKPRRRRERKHDASRVPDRIPDAPESPSYYSPTKSRTKISTFTKSLTARHTISSFRVEDDGCLGGF
ncbi:hypothetical protein H0H81_004458 [Sphagnurus paluster]|uniref:Uncharacterized protein n=1 Tax=Sphagnurus paluster TaxID=117069 RepID=A0A9P7GL14_9AGAR|nr:hypothetical protein H0H81_004458 [Sphagnurus paluster]